MNVRVRDILSNNLFGFALGQLLESLFVVFELGKREKVDEVEGNFHSLVMHIGVNLDS